VQEPFTQRKSGLQSFLSQVCKPGWSDSAIPGTPAEREDYLANMTSAHCSQLSLFGMPAWAPQHPPLASDVVAVFPVTKAEAEAAAADELALSLMPTADAATTSAAQR